VFACRFGTRTAAYEAFLSLYKAADIPILKEAKAEYSEATQYRSDDPASLCHFRAGTGHYSTTNSVERIALEFPAESRARNSRRYEPGPSCETGSFYPSGITGFVLTAFGSLLPRCDFC
jgi:hypothetical protein